MYSYRDEQSFALKIAKEMYIGDQDRKQKLEEVKKHEMLPYHRNIVQFHKSWEEGGKLHLVLELCQSTLKDEMKACQGRMPEYKVWAFTVDLLQALEHLHTNNLVHLDIKPENIFIGMDEICKLGDFGIMIDVSKGEGWFDLFSLKIVSKIFPCVHFSWHFGRIDLCRP